jgi:hypothetical protein
MFNAILSSRFSAVVLFTILGLMFASLLTVPRRPIGWTFWILCVAGASFVGQNICVFSYQNRYNLYLNNILLGLAIGILAGLFIRWVQNPPTAHGR